MTLTERVLCGCVAIAALAVLGSAVVPIRVRLPQGERVTCTSAHMAPSTIYARSFDRTHVRVLTVSQQQLAEQFQDRCQTSANDRLWAVTVAMGLCAAVVCGAWMLSHRHRHTPTRTAGV